MINGMYEFKEDDAWRYARTIGIKHRQNGEQLEFVYCPYCHGGSKRDQKTFAISLKTGQFECKRASCSVKGNMITLAKDFSDNGFELDRDTSIYYNIGNVQNSFKRFRDAHKEIEVRTRAIEYLGKRGISEDVCRKYEITTEPGKENVIVFPFKDETGALTFVKYRNADYQKESNSIKEWCIKGNYKKILFGMNHCEDFETLVITEGQIDSLSLAECGVKNAVSVPTGKNGFTWKPHCWNWMLKFNEIVVFGDNENGQVTLSKEITQFFPKRVRVVRIEDYKGCKDANELMQKNGKQAVLDAIENAEVRVSLRIKALTDVDDVDLRNITAYPTGIDALDSTINRGFHDGELIVLTGRCGEGKSTLSSQIVARMIQNGLKCFCYSGELPDFVFKAWLNQQVIGKSDIKEAEKEVLNNWYRNRIYIYDNSAVIDEDEELFNVMEQAVKDLNCKFIMIDNLMTAMENKSNEDLYRQQSEFIKRLTKFAKGFKIVIMLVAHPRKGTDTSNDSISGSGDITNRSDLVLRFQRKTERDGTIRPDSVESVLMVTKNRSTGKLNSEGIPLFYNRENMRLSENSDNSFVGFLGNDSLEDMGFTTVEELEIPF